MRLEDYRDDWQEQELSDDDRSMEEVLRQVKRRSEEYDRKIFWRDVREIGASVFVAGFFSYQAVTVESLLARIGALIVVAGAALVVWKLRRARSAGGMEHAARPVAERLRAEISKVETQIELLESVLWWYLAPAGIGVVLMVAAGGLEGWFEPVFLAALVAFFGFVWWLNQRTVECSQRPRRRELVQVLRQIEGPDASAGSGNSAG